MPPCGRFNPHPALRPGVTEFPGARIIVRWGFNPHPALRPGVTFSVSSRGPVGVFQSPPGLTAGCDSEAEE